MKRASLLLAAIAVGFTTPAVHGQAGLLEALRAGDAPLVRRLIAAGANPNTADPDGATALMYAAMYGSIDEMRRLIRGGADVNRANAGGATALMWAVHDPARVTLLIGEHADLDARSKSGASPLRVAIRLRNVDSARALVAAGADVKTDAQVLVEDAYIYGDPDIVALLARAGVETRNPVQLSALLPRGASLTRAGYIESLLAAGATPPKDHLRQPAFHTSVLGLAAAQSDLPAVRTLLDRGADPNDAGGRGITPLMMAAAAAEPDPNLVRLLVDRGANVRATDEDGRTALDWALMQGETGAAQTLRQAGATAQARPAPPSPTAGRPLRAAIAAAVKQLQPADPKFIEGAHCVSCHNETLLSVAVALARAKRVEIDETLAPHPHDITLKLWETNREELLLGRPTSIGGFTGTAAYGLFGLAEEHAAPTPLTDALAVTLAAQQSPDGSWNVADTRPPLFDSSAIHHTAMAIRGVAEYMPPGRRAERDRRIAAALAFLRSAPPRRTKEEVFKLLGLVWAKADASEIAAQRSRVLALQREDGGFAQRPTMASDAFQTGEALYALHAAGVAADGAPYQRGVRYLLTTQLEDGTWFVPTRAVGFQRYFETGFPHGRSQFISAAATAWAAIALAYAL
ncbi:MAG TPA: ankyrin repeat domain-containing protein [Vicinamibacterales bacterium]|jgi:ankyrin repeat protein